MAFQTITLVTGHRPSEPNILLGQEYQPLSILEDGAEVVHTVPAPEGGWTHSKLLLCPELTVNDNGKDHHYDAVLGELWIGSTEV
tara:strand:+ start:188 stop:442 length:255 start_codon:yes stop_codon:yes gene_type:complete